MQATMELSERQQAILRRVVEEFVGTGEPVGSKTLVQRSDLQVSPSTVRAELAELEARGLLTHPHTSAGRIPTERGYRYYADRLLERLEPQPEGFPLDLSSAKTEVDTALQATTEALSELTRLLALVSAPPLGTATVRHVEVLLLQPQLAMVVVITSTGGVTKRVYRFSEPVDPGLANWAAEYLNERVAGLELGSHLLRRRIDDPSLGAVERSFLQPIEALFREALDAEGQGLYGGGPGGPPGGARRVPAAAGSPREARGAARGREPGARPAAPIRAGWPGARPSGDARALACRRVVRPQQPDARSGVAPGPGADGLRQSAAL